ncbi:MAG: acetate--CoA ligase family protein [Alphaproteobacteria bacterium]
MDKKSLNALLKPRSVAVVGASPRSNVGGRMYRNMISAGFEGDLFPVNPNYDEIDGARCFPNIDSLPMVPDCVSFAVPYQAVFEPLEAAARRGVRSAVVVAEGFDDAATDAGRERQKRLAQIANDHIMAVSGPNCMGLIGLKAKFATAFTNLPKGLVTGSVSVVSQSGGLLNAVIELGHNRTLGFNYLLSAGNEAVVSSADLIDFLADDPGTSVILNIVEGIKDGDRYRQALSRAVARKPVIVLKLGRTDAGRGAALAHTGNLAGKQAIYDGVFKESGATQVRTIDELIETAAFFSRVKPPKGDRIFVFSVSGGATVLAGDLAQDAGLNMPPISRKTDRALQKILEVEHSFQNPMDVVGAPRLAKGDNLTRVLNVLKADPNYDLIAFVMVAQRELSESHRRLQEQYQAVAEKSAKPIVLISEMNWQPAERPTLDGPFISGTLDLGMKALKNLVDFGAHQEQNGKRRRKRKKP